MKSVDEITRNNSQVHDVSWRFGNWGVGNVVPLQREKFEGVNAEDWPYTQENKSRMIKSYGNYQEKSENAWWFRRKCLILHTD